jgi:hypothetical protein
LNEPASQQQTNITQDVIMSEHQCQRHAPLLRYEDANLTATCNGCYLGDAEKTVKAATANTIASIETYNKAQTPANREALSNAMFALEATLLFPDNNPTYCAALRLLSWYSAGEKS